MTVADPFCTLPGTPPIDKEIPDALQAAKSAVACCCCSGRLGLVRVGCKLLCIPLEVCKRNLAFQLHGQELAAFWTRP